jgi:hypothetical protein
MMKKRYFLPICFVSLCTVPFLLFGGKMADAAEKQMISVTNDAQKAISVPLDEETAASKKAVKSTAVKPAVGTDKTPVTVATAKGAASPAAADAKKTPAPETLPVPPTDEEAAWTLVGSNSTYDVYYDTRTLKADPKSGIITVWNKWVNKKAMGAANKTLLLQSQYDVRLRVVSDLVQYQYNALGQKTDGEKFPDTSWYPLSPDTLGMELCNALKAVFLNN